MKPQGSSNREALVSIRNLKKQETGYCSGYPHNVPYNALTSLNDRSIMVINSPKY